MELHVERHKVVDDALPGELFIDGVHEAATLENALKAIPAGRYQVIITPSNRAMEGMLWAPGVDYKLPLLCGVPNRSGIRIHAANEWSELEGCIAVGKELKGIWLSQSRIALTALLPKIRMALAVPELVWISVSSLLETSA